MRFIENKRPCWNTDDSDAGRYGIEDYSARPDDRTLANFNSWEGDSANSNMRKRTHRHTAAQENAG